MKRTIKVYLLILLIPVFCLGQSIDTKHLSLHLQFDWKKRQATGIAEITATLINGGTTIYLDAGKLNIQSIELNSQKLAYVYDGGEADNNIAITLNRNYAPSEAFTIKIAYQTTYENQADPNAISGSFGKGLRFFQATSTTPAKHKQVWSSGEPENNKYWFPCNEDIADIHTSEIYATVDKPLIAISNGELVSTKDNNNGTQTFHYKSAHEFPNYLLAIVVGEYTNIAQQAGKTKINNYGYPNEKEAVKATAALLPDMVSFLEEKTGFTYPFSSYSQVVVQDYPFPGLVAQNTMAILSDNYIDDYGVHQDFKYLWDGVAMQALANQWFGNLIMPKKWDDIWLNNAFAQYFAGMYTAKCNGNAEYMLWYHPFEKSAVLGDWEAGYKHPIVPKSVTDVASFTGDNYSKFRGVLILRMLQEHLGDETWWKVIRYFVKQNAHKQVSTGDFQQAVETVSGKSYQWFFDQWIYKIGLAKFEIVKNYDATIQRLTIQVKQIQNSENTTEYEQVAYFEGKISVEIGDKIETVILKPQQENTFIFEKISELEFVNFNYQQTFLCESNFTKSKEEYLAQLKKSKDVLAKQDAFNELVKLANDSSATLEFKVQVKQALTDEINSTYYWRYRMLALGALSRVTSLPYDAAMIQLLKSLIANEKYWLKSTAIGILGKTSDSSFTDIYINALNNESDRVINSAAVALGKTKSSKAYTELMKLESKSSWKNQNRISALNGLQFLADERAVPYTLKCIEDNHSPRWYLATPIWDYPYAAVNTLLALNKAHLAYTLLFERFKKSLNENDVNDIFQNVQLLNLLNDERAIEVYTMLKEKYEKDETIFNAVKNYESEYLKSLSK